MGRTARPEQVEVSMASRPWLSMRARFTGLALLCVMGSLALAGGLALHRAALEQEAIEASALASARATAHAADREIAAAIARMQALATSPALREGDLRVFYDQLVATPSPEGTWFVLWSQERQLLNTLRPFDDSPLPRISDFGPGSQASLRRVFATRQLAVSPVVWGVLAQAHVVAVTIPVVQGDEVTHLLDHILSDRRISSVIDDQRLAPTWRVILVDRYRGTVAHAGMSARPTVQAVPDTWADRMRDAQAEGAFVGEHEGATALVAFARSPMSGWTAVVEVPWAEVVAPVRRTVSLLFAGGGVVAAGAVVVALLAARGANRPLDALRITAAQARAGQREAEDRYSTYWQHADEALFVLSVTDSGRFIFEGLNPAYQRAIGVLSASIEGREPGECLPPATAATLMEKCRHCVETGEAVRYEETLEVPTGRRNWETSLAPVRGPGAGRVIRILGSARDVTERRRAEAALRGLGAKLLTLQDDERRRVARELHDSTAQILVGASFAAARIRAASSDLTEEADGAIEDTLSLIEESQREIRTLAYLLHPPLLDEMGLPAALRWYAKGLERRSGLAITVRVEPELERRRLPIDAESALFRIAQEALGNAHRHSGGTAVQVTLATAAQYAWQQRSECVVLAVQDNGRGFSEMQRLTPGEEDDPAPFGVGLVGMRQLGGRLDVRRAHPSGTVVEALVPVDAERLA